MPEGRGARFGYFPGHTAPRQAPARASCHNDDPEKRDELTSTANREREHTHVTIDSASTPTRCSHPLRRTPRVCVSLSCPRYVSICFAYRSTLIDSRLFLVFVCLTVSSDHRICISKNQDGLSGWTLSVLLMLSK